MSYPHTPDGRYFVAKGRLWRCSNPNLDPDERQGWVNTLMAARRAVRDADTESAEKKARARVDNAKQALGERGPVWWDDNAPDESRFKPDNSSYADWWRGLSRAEREAGG